MNHQHEPIMYSRKKFFKTNKIPHQLFSKVGDEDINKNQEYSNFLHKYCDADHARNIYGRRSVTSTVHLSDGTIIDWCAKK